MLLDPVGEAGRAGEQRVEQRLLVDRADHLAGGHRRLGADDRHLADAVLAEDVDRVADGLVRVGVHQRRRLAGLRAQHLADGLAGGDVEEAVVGHPLVAEDLVEVAAAAVGQQDDDDVVLGQLLGGAQRGDDGHAAGAADQQALLAGQPPGHREGVAVGDRDDLVGDVAVVGGRPEVLADALDEVGPAGAAGVDRALGVGADDRGRGRRRPP